jgi:beta-lactam-binding protein with PASTA domain
MNDGARLLAGRYEVGDLIGRGGMAEVHIGYDTRLGRNVAIKILRADLARDPSFQTRFRREAQAAAGLNHPAIVAVYDTGEDQIRTEQGGLQAVPFIVMEYVEGHTVRDILKGDVAAPIDEAIEITMGVLSALDYAHHAGLVHRDIKPANVMLTPTGAVKVMDFGIARALADVGQTMTQSQAVVGTAQYLSPEQARGENVDARSDLYSTGCLLFELLTGRPPFVGDSPVSVAYQHVREAAPRPSQFASDVPSALDAVVERALQKDRANRYSTAQEFMADLQRVLDPSAAPASGANPIGSAAYGAGAAGVAAAGIGGAALGAGAGQAPSSPYAPYGGPSTPGEGQPETGPTAVMPAAVAAGGSSWGSVMGGATPPVAPRPTTSTLVTDEELVEDTDSRRRTLIQVGIAVAALIALILLVFAIFKLAGPKDDGPVEPDVTMVTIPDLQNFLQEDAEERLTNDGLKVDVEEEMSQDVEKGRVIRTEPPAGEQVEEGFTVLLVVSSGPDQLQIPDVRGKTQQEAIDQLEELGLKVTGFENDNDPDVEKGRATRTDPVAGTEVAVGSEVILYVSSGQVEVPELRNKSAAEAQQELIKLGLLADVQQIETNEYSPGIVFEQSPLPGLVNQGSVVTLKVAKAPTTVAVPNVVGKTINEATALLQGAGLKVQQTTATSDTVENGKVISSNPSAGIQVAVGTTVTITVSTGPGGGPPPEDP